MARKSSAAVKLSNPIAQAGLELYGIECRRLIKGKEIIGRLCRHALAKEEMTATQIRAAEVLLRKCLPDLQAVEITGAGGQALTVQIIRFADGCEAAA